MRTLLMAAIGWLLGGMIYDVQHGQTGNAIFASFAVILIAFALCVS